MSTGPPPTDGILFYGETGVVAGIAALAVARLWRLSMPVDAVALTVLTALGLAAVMAGSRPRGRGLGGAAAMCVAAPHAMVHA